MDFDVAQALRDLWAANPGCLMFGTDLPSTRAPTPFSNADLAVVRDTFDPAAAARILYGNAAELYHVAAVASDASEAAGAPAWRSNASPHALGFAPCLLTDQKGRI